MTKKFMLTAIAVLFSTLVALAQTEPQTQPVSAGKTEKAAKKDKTDKIKHAEERSDGAAFSGKGKGREKDQVEKDKAKAKKEKKKKKDKGNKGKKKSNEAGDAQSDGSGKDASAPAGKWEQKSAPNEKAPNTRQPGEKPAAGTEMQKERKSRG